MPRRYGRGFGYDDDDIYTDDLFWWNAPAGWTDLELYDYNRNYILDDEEIEDIIWDNLSTNPFITWSDQQRIEVSVKDGIATLSGEVRNPRTKPLAYADAFWSSGVIDVVSNITVKEARRRDNKETEEKQEESKTTESRRRGGRRGR